MNGLPRSKVAPAVIATLFLNAQAAPLAQTLGCPASNEASALTTWRLQAASSLQNGSIAEDAVQSQINQCLVQPLPLCVQRLNDYTQRNDVAHADADVTAANSPEKTPPSEVWAPGGDSGQYVLPTDIEATAAQRGWLTVRYKSRHSGGFDPETPSLLMVYVPGDKVDPPVGYDRWLNFPLPADSDADAMNPVPQAHLPTADDYAQEANGQLNLPHTFTMVSLDRKTGPGAPGKVYFQKFDRSQDGSPNFTPESNAEPASCYGCHPSGLRAISPLGFHVRAGEPQLDPASWKATKQINDAMDLAAGRSEISWRDAVDDSGTDKPLLRPLAQGPVVGPMQPLNPDSRSQAFIVGGVGPSGTSYPGCSTSRTEISVRDIFGRAPGANNVYTLSANPTINWQKIRASMSCEGCHNNKFRGALNAQISFSEIEFKILVDQSMPQGAHQDPLDQGLATAPVHDTFTPDERIALANCLRDEFTLEGGHLADWLTQIMCQ